MIKISIDKWFLLAFIVLVGYFTTLFWGDPDLHDVWIKYILSHAH